MAQEFDAHALFAFGQSRLWEQVSSPSVIDFVSVVEVGRSQLGSVSQDSEKFESVEAAVVVR